MSFAHRVPGTEQAHMNVNETREVWKIFSGSQLLLKVISLETDFRIPRFTIRLPGGSDDKESTCNAGDWGLIPGSGRSPGEGNSRSSILARIPSTPSLNSKAYDFHLPITVLFNPILGNTEEHL